MLRFVLPAALLALAPAAAFAAAPPIGITRAVAIAEKAVGGRGTEAELDRRGDGGLVYEVELATSDTLYEVDIDARNGRVLDKRRLRLASYYARWFDSGRLESIASGRSLSQLLGDLERRSGGRVREVSFDVEGGQPRYEVEISTAAGVADIYLNPKTGERLSLVYDD